MIYHSTVTDINGKKYRFLLHSKYDAMDGTTTEEIEYMGRDAFVVSRNSDHLYKPYKCSDAVANLYIPNVLEVLEGMGHHNMVCIWQRYDSVSNKWDNLYLGCVTDNSFNQDFIYEYDSFELSFQDYFSTLRYHPFRLQNGERPRNRTFLELLFEGLQRLNGMYSDIYITKSKYLTDAESENIFKNLLINDICFIDEDDKNDNWTYLQIIEEMCKYLNVSIIPQGDKLYIVDYSTIAGDRAYHTYTHYQAVRPPRATTNEYQVFFHYGGAVQYREVGDITLRHDVVLAKDMIADSDTNISVDGCREVIKVTAKIDNISELSPDYSDAEYYIPHQPTSAVDGQIDIIAYPDNHIKTEYLLLQDGRGGRVQYSESQDIKQLFTSNRSISQDGNREDVLVVRGVEGEWDSMQTSQPRYIKDLYIRPLTVNQKQYTNLGISTNRYKVQGNTISPSDRTIWDYDSLIDETEIGVLPIQQCKLMSNSDDVVRLDKVDYLFCGHPRKIAEISDKELITFSINNVPCREDSLILIGGVWEAFMGRLTFSDTFNENRKIAKQLTHIEAYISLTDEKGVKTYWDGSNWITTKTLARLPLDVKEGAKPYGQSYKMKNNILPSSFIGDKRGLSIPLPSTRINEISFRDLSIAFVYPTWFGVYGDFDTNISYANRRQRERYPQYRYPSSVLLTDFSVDILSRDMHRRYFADSQGNKDKERVHSNYWGGDFYETEEVDLKLCTNLDKKNLKNCVYQNQNGRIEYNLLYLSRGTQYWSPAEEQIVTIGIIQWWSPTITLTTTVLSDRLSTTPYTTIQYPHLGERYFVINSLTENYINNTTTLSLIEVKTPVDDGLDALPTEP